MNTIKVKLFECLFSQFTDLVSISNEIIKSSSFESSKTYHNRYTSSQFPDISINTSIQKDESVGIINFTQKIIEIKDDNLISPINHSQINQLIDHFNHINAVFNYHSTKKNVVSSLINLNIFSSITLNKKDDNFEFNENNNLYVLEALLNKNKPELCHYPSCMSVQLINNEYHYLGHDKIFNKIENDYNKLFENSDINNTLINEMELESKIIELKQLIEMVNI